MGRIFRFLILPLIAFNFTFSQSGSISPLQGRLLLSFNGAVAIPKTDYSHTIPSPLGIGAVEYYFGIKSKHTLGARFYGGTGVLEGSDDNRLPDKYSDEIFFFGGGLTYCYALNNQFVPYLSFTASNIWYNPKDNNDNAIITTKPVSENLSKTAYNYELGLKIYLSENSILNIGGGEFISLADDLDGTAAGSHNDVIFYGTVGISIAFFGETDSDRIPDYTEAEKTEPETRTPEPEIKKTEPEIKEAEPQIKKTESEIRKPEPEIKKTEPEIKKPEPEIKKAEPEIKEAEPEIKKAEPGKKEPLPETKLPEPVNILPEPEVKVPEAETSKPPSETKAEVPQYDVENEHLVKNMIFTDGKLFTAQISSWKTKWKAESIVEVLKSKGYNAFVREFYIEKVNETWFQVRVGYFKTFRDAQKVVEELR